MATSFKEIYDVFLNSVTEDMYLELTEEETENIIESLLLNSLVWFEFPRVDIYDIDKEAKCFNVELSMEEQNILGTYMIVEWLGVQLASVENARMKYSGTDFKFTSQANHMNKLQALKQEYVKEGFHKQRLYKRRKKVDGVYKSTFGQLAETLD